MTRSLLTTLTLVALAGALFTTVACEPVGGPVEVEALIPDDDAPYGYRLQTVTLEQIEDLMQGTGRDFDVRSGTTHDIGSGVVAAALGGDEVQAVRGGGGQPAAPNLSFDGQRWVGNDWDSILYLTALHNFEEAFRYYRDVVGDTSGATTVKGLVGLSQRGIVWQNLPLELPMPFSLHDNASYNKVNDSWVLVPHARAPFIPVSASMGVIGHEFGHRVFNYNVILESGVDDLPRLEETQHQKLVLGGLNEGLADILAVGMMSDPSFMVRAFGAPPLELTADKRDLEGEFATTVTYGGLLAGEHEGFCGDPMPPADTPADAPKVAFSDYCLGVLAANVLWETSGRDAETLRHVVNPAVVASMRGLAARIVAANADKVEDDPMTFDIVMYLDATAEALPEGELRSRFCALAEERFAAALTDTDIPFCR